MKLETWSKSRALVAGAVLIAVTNAIALGGVAYNRAGEPQSALALTERELPMTNRNWLDHHNSGIDLNVSWRVRVARVDSIEGHRSWHRSLEWLSEDEITALGFDPPVADATGSTRGWDPPTREAFFVLESDGEAYRAVLELARQALERETALAAANPGVDEFTRRVADAQRTLTREEQFATRLFVVDVGREAAALRARYPDRARNAIVRGRLDARLEGEPHALSRVVYVLGLDIDTISVPHAFRHVVEPLTPATRRYGYEDRAPRYHVTVNYGRRLEPWIVGLRELEADDAGAR